MTREELGLESFVVVGNALHLLLHGVPAEQWERLPMNVDAVRGLYAALEPVPAQAILAAMDGLRKADRRLLADAVDLSRRLAGAQSETLLGAPEATQIAIAQWLRDAHPSNGEPL